jgi:hypothetical protein
MHCCKKSSTSGSLHAGSPYSTKHVHAAATASPQVSSCVGSPLEDELLVLLVVVDDELVTLDALVLVAFSAPPAPPVP